MINLKASRKTGTINVGVNPITNINVSNPGQAASIVNPTLNYPNLSDPNFPSVAPVAVDPNSPGPTITEVQYKTADELEKEALLREINVLKLIIDIQHSYLIYI